MKPELNCEYPEPGEAKLVEEMLTLTKLRAEYIGAQKKSGSNLEPRLSDFLLLLTFTVWFFRNFRSSAPQLKSCLSTG